MVSPRRRFGSERIAILVGVSALALAPLCADAAPTYWPIRKRVRRPYATDRVEVYTAATSTQKLVFESDEATEIIADSSVVKNELHAGGHSGGGISARIKAVEDHLETLRVAYNAISFDTLNSAKSDCDTKLTDFRDRVEALEAAVVSPDIIPIQCNSSGVAGLRRESISGTLQWTCPCVNNYTDDGGVKCAKASCAVPATLQSGRTAGTIVDTNCAIDYLQHGTAGECEFSCAADSMPSHLNGANTPGTLTCDDGTLSGPSSPGCTDCDTALPNVNHTGVNCRLQGCPIPTGFATAVSWTDCATSIMKSGTAGDCDFSCPADHIGTTATSPGKALMTCVTDNNNVTTVTPNANFCVTCDSKFVGTTHENKTGVDCETAACTLPTSMTNVIHDCGVSTMKEGGSCSYSCPSGQMPSAETNVDTPGSISCTSGSVSAHTCTDCNTKLTSDQNRTGVNCATAACAIPTNFASSVRWTDCATSKMKSGSAGDCFYSCAANNIGTTATIPGKATMTCATPTVTPNANFCVTCDSKFVGTTHENKTGVDCETAACTLPTSMTNVIHDCGVSTMKEGGSCSYSCPSGQMPSAETNVDTPGSISCTSGSVSAHTCTDCNTKLTSDQNRTGVNCATAACAIPTDFGTGQNGVIQSCATSLMEAGSTCTFSCQNGRPTAMDANGEGHEFQCNTDGSLTKTSGGTAADLTCSSCVNDYSGVNCAVEPCQIDTTVLDGIQNIASHNCTSTLPVGQGAESVCRITCQAGYQAQNGVISCEAASTSGTTISVDNVQCVSTE